MKAGYADIDITPEPGEEMTGYGYFTNRRAIGTLDPLRARALALEDGDARAVIVQLDLLGLSKQFVADVREEAYRRFGLPQSHLMLHCTHTHSGPATMTLHGCGMPSQSFLYTLHHQLVSVVGDAIAALSPTAATRRFEGDFPQGFANNRVGGTDLDSHVRGLWIELPDARPILVISYACHPVVLGANREYSADYCGAVIREFNAYGIRTLYLNGCSGDINPMSNAYRFGSGTTETLLIYGRDLASAVRRAMEHSTDWPPGPPQASSRMLQLDAAEPGVEELRAALEQHREALREDPTSGPLRVEVLWHEGMLRLAEANKLNEAREAEIQAIACGDAVFVALSAETFTRIGQMVRNSAPDHHLMIAATSNGVIGYIADRDDVAKSGYASSSACRIYGMLTPTPGAGEQWATEGAAIVAEAIGER